MEMSFKMEECHKCPLFGLQPPLLSNDKKADIMVIGLSAKIRKFENEVPLDSRTRSGKLIDELEKLCARLGLTVYRTNLVKCAPIDMYGKLRYPNQEEIEECFSRVIREIEEISPRAIVLLGDRVRETFAIKWNIQLKKPEEEKIPILRYENKWIVSMYHPSYLMRSKNRSQLHIDLFRTIISEIFGE